MSPTLWSLLAAVPAVWAEYLYRTMARPWWHYLWLWVPLQLFIGYSIYKIVTFPGQPLVGALIVWSFAIIGLRVFTTVFLLHDKVPPGTWAALGLMVVARIVQTVWK